VGNIEQSPKFSQALYQVYLAHFWFFAVYIEWSLFGGNGQTCRKA